jgi:taurine dioxygenase
MNDHATATILPTGAALGAEIRGVDLRHLDDAGFAAILAAWTAHEVLLFRGQDLDDDGLAAFSRRLGRLDHAPVQENGRSIVVGRPEIYVVSNVVENGVAIGSLGAGEAVWHTDMSYLEAPPKASLLYALEVPQTGGDTWFCDMYAAHDALPEALRRRVGGLLVKHDGTYNSGGFVRQGVVPTDDPRQAPGRMHPLICRHPDSGRPMLYLGRRRMAWLGGLDLAESEALLDEIWAHATQPAFTWRHRWQAGDLVMWDNRCTMHRRDPFDAASRRIMHRTQVAGMAPPAGI